MKRLSLPATYIKASLNRFRTWLSSVQSVHDVLRRLFTRGVSSVDPQAILYQGPNSPFGFKRTGDRYHDGCTLVKSLVFFCLAGIVSAEAAELTLAWNDNSTDETGFKLERSVAGGPFVEIAVLGADVVSFVDTNVVNGTVYSYRVRAYSSTLGESAYSNVMSNAPTITTQPTSQTVTAGNPTSFNAVVAGVPVPTLFQWERSTNGGSNWTAVAEGNPYSGVATTTLTISPTAVDMDTSLFRIVATNSLGSTASTSASLTVNTLPVFTTQPVSQATAPGGNASFTVAVTSALPVTYFWQRSGDAGATWTGLSNASPYSGVTNAALSIAAATVGLNTSLYRCVVTSVAGSVSSNAAVLNVNVAPNIAAQPQNQTTIEGDSATFTIAANGFPTPAYQWQVFPAGGVAWVDLSNSNLYADVTTSQLTITGATVNLSTNLYRCVVSNGVGTVVSNNVTLTVYFAPAFTTHPANSSVNIGQNRTLSVAANANPTPTFQWEVSTDGGTSWSALANDSAYTAVTAPAMTILTATVGLGNNQYRCVATNLAGSTSSTAAILTVNTPPVFTTSPISQTVVEGDSASLSVAVSGIPLPAIQWQISVNGGANWAPLSDTGPYSGVTSTTLGIGGTPRGLNNNQYRAVASNVVSFVNSAPAVLTVSAPPLFVNQPGSRTVSAGSNTTFTVAVSGNPSPTLQWQRSTDGGATWADLINASPYSGVTTVSLSITAAAASLSATQYRCVGTNSLGSVASDPAILVVNTPPFFSSHPSNRTVSAFGNTTFSVVEGGSPAPTLQWQRSLDGGATWSNLADATLYSGVTTATLAIAGATGDLNASRYRCVATSVAGSALTATGILSVTRIPQNITFNPPAAKTYGDLAFSPTASSSSGLTISYASSNPAVATVSGSIVTIVGAGATTITASQVGDINYLAAGNVAQTLTVGKAPLSVTANAASRAYGALDPVFTSTIAGFVNGETLPTSGVTGAPTFTHNATASSPVGGSYLIVPGVGTLISANYSFNFVSGPLTVTKAPLVVTADNQSRAYGSANPALTATISGFRNGESLGTSGVTGTAAVSTAANAASAVGSYPITAALGSLAGSNYSFTFADGSLSVTKAPLTVTADNQSRAYGGANPALTATISGFVNGESLGTSGVTGTPVVSTTANSTSIVGSYALTPTLGTLTSSNYSFSFTDGALSVTKAPLTVSADNTSRAYGSLNPAFSATISGFANGENLGTSGVTGSPSLSTAASAASAVGSYPITPSLGTLSATNYSFSFADGSLLVTKATLTVTADSKFRTYGAADPAFSVTISGFVNGENLASSGVTGSPTLASSASVNSPVGGAYTITPALGSLAANNYSFTFASGALTVSKAPLTVTADPAARAYGGADPAFSATISGFVNGENLASSGVIGAPAFSTNATVGSPVGTYTITPASGGLSAANYSFSFAPGNLTVSKAPLTVTANAAARTYGAADPVFSATISGFANGENLASSGVTGSPAFSTNATAASPVSGTYAIVPIVGTLAAGNYSFTFAPGVLSITKAPLTVTADPASRAFGAADPAFTATLTGFVNGEAVGTAGISGNPAFTTAATVTSPVGTYPITPAAGTLTAPNYSFVTMVPGTLTISQATQTIDFPALANRFVGEAPFAPNVTASSGLPVSIVSSNPAVATVSGSTVTVVAAGTANLTASQVGNSNYLAATDVVRTLTVLASTPPVFTTHPSSQSVVSGTNVVFTVAATGGPSPSFKWQLSANSGASWSDLTATAPYSGVTTNTLTIMGVSVALSGAQYRAVAANASGSVNSNAAVLTVSAPVTPPPVVPPPPSSTSAPFFLTHPVGQVVQAGANVTLTASLTGTPTPSLQWRKNGVAIAGANSATLTLAAVTQIDAGAYALFASNSAGSVLSNPATITVQSAPVFVSQPSSVTVAIGATVVLSAALTGTPEPTLHWQRNGSPVGGATGGTLTLNNVGPGDAGTYVVVATNSLGTASSVGAVVTVSGAPVITTQPVGQTVLAGTSLTLSVTASGSPAPTYQWRRNAAAIAGATAASLGLTNIKADGAGTYDVVVSNSAGSVTSLPAIIVVDTPSYAGTYFGSFPDGGSWALYVRFDNTATYLAFLPGSSTAIVTNLTINLDGTFSVTGSTIAAASAVSPLSLSLPPSTAAAPIPFTFSGRITNGRLTAEVLGRPVTGTADTGTTQGAGFYSAPALLTATGSTFSVVGPSGRTLIVATTPTAVDGGVGTLSGTGVVSVATSSGAQLAVTVNADGKSIAATYTPSGSSIPVNFSGISDAVRATAALANLSIRSTAGTLDQTLIVGFVVAGNNKPVLMRGIGPALAGFGVTGSLPDPRLDLVRAGIPVASNDNWTATAGDVFARVGAFALNAGSRDAAVVATLEAASYTAQLSDAGGATGIALLELYDTAADNGGRLVNVSARSQVGTGGGILIAGFNVSGAGPRRMLIRAIGPGLTAFGVAGALADPKLDLFETGNSAVIASNDNWEPSTSATFGAVGAFGLTAGSRDAVLVVTLTPGSYTAQVSGVGNATGVALVEVYEVRE